MVNRQLVLQNEISNCEKQDSTPVLASPSPLDRSAPIHFGGNRQATRAPGFQQVASVAKPETILAWYRKLIARKFDSSTPHLPGFLHRRRAHLSRVGNLSRSVLLTPGDATRHARQNHPASHAGMDSADGSQCHRGDGALLPVRASSSMIAARSSATPSELCFGPAEFAPFCCRHAVPI